MSASVETFDPLERYVSDLDTLRKALDESDAIVQGPWILSVFVGGDEAMLRTLRSYSLGIVVPKDNAWLSISNVLEKNEYQLCGHPNGGLLFARKSRDDLSLIFNGVGDRGWMDPESLQAGTIRKVMSQEFGCFMTSKYAVLICNLSSSLSDRDPIEKIVKSIIANHETRIQGSDKERWKMIGNRLFGIIELNDFDKREGSFNHFLSRVNIFSYLSALPS